MNTLKLGKRIVNVQVIRDIVAETTDQSIIQDCSKILKCIKMINRFNINRSTDFKFLVSFNSAIIIRSEQADESIIIAKLHFDELKLVKIESGGPYDIVQYLELTMLQVFLRNQDKFQKRVRLPLIEEECIVCYENKKDNLKCKQCNKCTCTDCVNKIWKQEVRYNGRYPDYPQTVSEAAEFMKCPNCRNTDMKDEMKRQYRFVKTDNILVRSVYALN